MPRFIRNHTKALARCAAVWFILLTALSAFADDSKIAPDLQPLLSNPSNKINVIVQYNTPVPSSAPGGGLLGGLLGGVVGTVVNLLGGVLKTVFTLIPALSATLNPSQLVGLSNQSNVSYISLDRSLAASLDYSAAAVNAPYAWNSGLDGTGIGVAVIDSGIFQHPDLNGKSGSSRVVYRQSFIGGTQFDDYGHGTHVAGIVGGNASSSAALGTGSYKGIAPNANIIDLRVLDQNGISNDSVVIAAIEEAVKLKSKYNIRVINLSLGRPIYESCTRDPLCQAVDAAWKQGIVVVVAAGNLGRNGYSTILSPGNNPHVITVGAMKAEDTLTRTDDLIASYSSRGPTYIDLTAKPDVVAPGNMVTSLLAPGTTLLAEFPANVMNAPGVTPGRYFQLSGTSMATPVVSGAAALLLEKYPNLTPDAVKARLMKTAYKTFPASSTAVDPTTGQSYTDTYDMFTVGAGYVDVLAALNSTDQVTGVALSPSLYYNQLLNLAILLNPLGSCWNNGALSLDNVWGPHVIQSTVGGASAAWGTSAAWGSSAAWGTSAAWGSSAAWGTSAAWGSSAAWGTSAAWGSSAAWGTTVGSGEK